VAKTNRTKKSETETNPETASVETPSTESTPETEANASAPEATETPAEPAKAEEPVKLTRAQAKLVALFHAAGEEGLDLSDMDERVVKALEEKGVIRVEGTQGFAVVREKPARATGSGRRTKASAVEQPCLCGCGTLCKRNFAQGHDMKLRSSVQKYARAMAKPEGERGDVTQLTFTLRQWQYLTGSGEFDHAPHWVNDEVLSAIQACKPSDAAEVVA